MIEDLSLRHELVSGLFELPETPADWRKHRLSKARCTLTGRTVICPGPTAERREVEVLCEELTTLSIRRIQATGSSTNITATRRRTRRPCCFTP